MTEIPHAIDVSTGRLGTLCSSWRDVQQTRLALTQRGFAPAAAALLKVEQSMGRQISRELRVQPVWLWLAQFPGLRGVHVARLVAIIGDPRRFPGQGCTEGHAFVPDYALGDQCPNLTGPEAVRCEGTVVARVGTGVRSLWRYLGLDVVDGRSPRRRKGQQGHWHVEGRAAVLQPGGIAEQIVRLGVEPYVSTYRAQKARLASERAKLQVAIDVGGGPLADSIGSGSDDGPVIEASAGLRPFQIDALARKIAAKQFIGDLLLAMKRALPVVEAAFVIERSSGRGEIAA